MVSAEGNKKSFAEHVVELRALALASGISEKVLDGAFEGIEEDFSVIEKLENQPEHTNAVWDYIKRAASEDRIRQGRDKLDAYSGVLSKIEKKYNVDPAVLVAIWGLESSYGTNMGTDNAIRSLATLAAFGGRRAGFGKEQLIAALKILENGDVTPEGLTGSWAGAMGHTQFIPTTYLAHAVDFDGDGKRNIWGSVADALASTANYLRVSGWRPENVWGVEVTLPPDFDFSEAGYGQRKKVQEWAGLGVDAVAGAMLPDGDAETSLILPAGANGPRFLVTRNFRAILRYNNATAYALAIAHLADRLNDKGPIVQEWPLDEKPLGRSERAELQGLLNDVGFSPGGVDGIIGSATRKAVRQYQRSKQLPVDGYPSTKLLDMLRREANL